VRDLQTEIVKTGTELHEATAAAASAREGAERAETNLRAQLSSATAQAEQLNNQLLSLKAAAFDSHLAERNSRYICLHITSIFSRNSSGTRKSQQAGTLQGLQSNAGAQVAGRKPYIQCVFRKRRGTVKGLMFSSSCLLCHEVHDLFISQFLLRRCFIFERASAQTPSFDECIAFAGILTRSWPALRLR